MSTLLCAEGLRHERRGAMHIYARADLPAEMLLATLAEPGTPLKVSRKSTLRRVGPWAVKTSAGSTLVQAVRLNAARERYRQAWRAAHHLEAHGVLVPPPLAYLETRRLGLVWGNVYVAGFLEDHVNVEVYAERLAERAGAQHVAAFLGGLAQAVNRLNASGAYHADLSGKNIFTHDGRRFYFLDLDAVSLDTTYTRELRKKNHVQLYDSFCDLYSDALMVPFIEAMLDGADDLRVWMPAVRAAQRQRRARIEAIWERQALRTRQG